MPVLGTLIYVADVERREKKLDCGFLGLKHVSPANIFSL